MKNFTLTLSVSVVLVLLSYLTYAQNNGAYQSNAPNSIEKKIIQQFEKDNSEWRGGKMVMINDDSINCELKYNKTHDILQAKVEGEIITMSPKYIKYFVYDSTTYIAAKADVTFNDYKQFVFFEVDYTGKYLSLLGKRPSLAMAKATKHAQKNGLYPELHRRLYFMNEKGEVFPYSVFTKTLHIIHTKKDTDVFYGLIEDKRKEIEVFMKENNLSETNKEDLIKILAYYNEIKDE